MSGRLDKLRSEDLKLFMLVTSINGRKFSLPLGRLGKNDTSASCRKLKIIRGSHGPRHGQTRTRYELIPSFFDFPAQRLQLKWGEELARRYHASPHQQFSHNFLVSTCECQANSFKRL